MFNIASDAKIVYIHTQKQLYEIKYHVNNYLIQKNSR